MEEEIKTVQKEVKQIQYSKYLQISKKLDKLDKQAEDFYIKFHHSRELHSIKREYVKHKAQFCR